MAVFGKSGHSHLVAVQFDDLEDWEGGADGRVIDLETKIALTRHKLKRRFIIAAIAGLLALPFQFKLAGILKTNLSALLPAFGLSVLFAASLIAWVLTFRCPRCGHFFVSLRSFFQHQQFGECVHCHLSLGPPAKP